MPYLLDADVFIEAKDRHYGFDFCPAFWDWLIERNGAGLVFSVEKVAEDIQKGNDDLATWAAGLGPAFFLPAVNSVPASLSTLSTWATSRAYTQAAIAEFFGSSDYHLIGHGHAAGFTVVTHERSEPLRTGKIKIPDACAGVGVVCMTPYEMLRIEQARFVLGAAQPGAGQPGQGAP